MSDERKEDKEKKIEQALSENLDLVKFSSITKEISDAKKPTLLMERFANEYIIDYNYQEAAKRCGINSWQANAVGLKLLESPLVQNLISNLQLSITQKLQISKERVLQEWFDLATYNAQDFVDEDNNPKPLSELTRGQAAAVQSIKKTNRTRGKETVEETEIKMFNKLNALKELAQQLGMNSSTGTNINIQLNQMFQNFPPELQEILKEKMQEKFNKKNMIKRIN